MPLSMIMTHYPLPNPPVEAAIGRFIIAWNVLEQEIDLAIHDLLQVSPAFAYSVTANLGTKAKLDMYHSLIYGVGGESPERSPFYKAIDALIGDTGNASGRIRNMLVHGQPLQLLNGDTPVDHWGRMTARKGGAVGTVTILTEPLVNGYVTDVKAIVDRWRDLRTDIFAFMNAGEPGD